LPAALPTVHWPTRYEWPQAEKWGAPVRQGLRELTTVEPSRIPQRYHGTILFEIAYPGERPQPVALDYHDHMILNEECRANVALYFKMQYRRDGYGDARTVPGGYVASKRSLYEHYGRLRALRARGDGADAYGRFGVEFSADLRRQAVDILDRQTRFRYRGGTSLVFYMRSLREAAAAGVCIDLPGNGPLCFRLVDYLAMGACVIAPRHAAILNAELVDRQHIVYCREDLADLTDLCAQYLEDERARRQVGENAARFFDEHLQPRQLAAYYLRALNDGLRGGERSERAA
jgi:Glycosyl transferases group 1